MTASAAATILPADYGFVALVLVAYCFLNFWMAMQVGKARRKYKVFYPTLYALESENKDAKRFNCVQRGHQNSLEFVPIFFSTLLIGGLQHPRIASALGAVYVVARFFYFRGYSTGVPENRLKVGGFNFLAIIGLIFCTASLGVRLVARDTL